MLSLAALWAALRRGRDDAPSADSLVRFVPGQRLVYQLVFDGTAASSFAAVFQNGQPNLPDVFEIALHGTLSVTVLEADAEHTALVYRLAQAEARFQVDGQDDPERSLLIQRGLGRPVFVRLDHRGRIQSLWFDSETGALAKDVARALLAATQVVGPEAGAAAPGLEWDADENDQSGALVAHYHRLADGTVHKTKLRYVQPEPTKRGRTIVLSPTIQSDGEYVATLDAAGCLTGRSVTDAQSQTVQEKFVGQGTLKLDVHLLRKEAAPATELAALGATHAEQARTDRGTGLYVPRSPEQDELAIQRQELGSATIEGLLADLAMVERAKPQERDVTRLFLKFKALAIVRPETCAKLAGLLSAAEAGSLRMHLLADALEAAGNPAAQAALCAVAQSRAEDEPSMAILIPALSAAESPTPQTQQTLERLAFQSRNKHIASKSQLALGHLARNLADESPSRAAKIVQQLLQNLADPAAADSRWQLLLAVGNSGSLEALPTLTRYLDNPAPDLRGAAAWAMRWINSPDVDRLLTAKVLPGEKDRAVRLEAVRALQFREKAAANFEAQKQALSAEAEPDIRAALLVNLWEFRDSQPEAQRLVEKAAANDPDSSVRAAAAKLLQPAETAP